MGVVFFGDDAISGSDEVVEGAKVLESERTVDSRAGQRRMKSP